MIFVILKYNLFLIFLNSIATLDCAYANLNSPAYSTPSSSPTSNQDFFKNPEVTQFSISPNGQWLAYLHTHLHRLNIFIKPVHGETSPQPLTQFTDHDVQHYMWKGDQTLLFFKTPGGDLNDPLDDHLFKVDLSTQTITDLTPFPKVRVKILNLLDEKENPEIVMTHNQRDPKVFDVYRTNVVTMKTKLIFKNPGDLMDFITDHHGRVRMARRMTSTGVELLYRPSEQSEFKIVMSFDYQTEFKPLMFTSDNLNVLALSQIEHDKLTLVEFDPRRKKVMRVLYQHPSHDLSDTLLNSPLQKKIMGISVVTWKLEHAFFDADWERAFTRMSDEVGSPAQIKLTHKSRNEKKFIFFVSSDRDPGRYFLLDRSNARLELLGSEAPWLKKTNLALMRPIQFQSRDGLILSGYVTLPVQIPAHHLPFVVWVHDGPWDRDTWGFHPMVQFLAQQGYGVLQINYRGSTGYGRRWTNSSQRQWGLKMQDDLEDGIRWIIGQGLANSKKIAIAGEGYGGYAALMAATRASSSSLFACAASLGGPSHLSRYLKNLPPYEQLRLNQLYSWIGNPEKDQAQFIQTSPLLQVHKIKIPLFIAHGLKNPLVSAQESQQMIQALKARGLEVRSLLKETEGLHFQSEESRLELATELDHMLASCFK